MEDRGIGDPGRRQVRTPTAKLEIEWKGLKGQGFDVRREVLQDQQPQYLLIEAIRYGESLQMDALDFQLPTLLENQRSMTLCPREVDTRMCKRMRA